MKSLGAVIVFCSLVYFQGLAAAETATAPAAPAPSAPALSPATPAVPPTASEPAVAPAPPASAPTPAESTTKQPPAILPAAPESIPTPAPIPSTPVVPATPAPVPASAPPAPILEEPTRLVLLRCAGDSGLLGGETMVCEVWLAKAPTRDIVLNISLLGTDTAAAITAPEVTVSAGQQKRLFSVVTRAVSQDTPVTVSVSHAGESLSATRTLLPPTLKEFGMSKPEILGGTTAIARISLTGPAPSEGLMVHLASSHADIVPVPPTLLVPANARDFTFELSTRRVEQGVAVMLSASAAGQEQEKSYPLFVAHDPRPDLAVINWSYKVRGKTVSELPRGRAFKLCVDVANKSYAPAPPSRLRLLMLTSQGQDLTLEAEIPRLKSGGQKSHCFPLPALDPAFAYTFNIYADYGNTLGETNEGDNVMFGHPSPTAPPSPPAGPAGKPAPRPTAIEDTI